MRQADGTFSFVHVLTTGTGCPEGIYPHIVHVELHVHLFGFWQHSHGGSRRMDASLRFGGRHPLHPVHTGFIF